MPDYVDLTVGKDEKSMCRRQEPQHQGLVGKQTLSHQRTNVEEDMRGEITSWRNSRARRYVTHSTHFLKRQSRE